MPHYTPQAAGVIEALRRIVRAYNFDGSESQVDYFHVNFYSDCTFDLGLELAERNSIRAAH
jgi:hypothetical protein